MATRQTTTTSSKKSGSSKKSSTKSDKPKKSTGTKKVIAVKNTPASKKTSKTRKTTKKSPSAKKTTKPSTTQKTTATAKVTKKTTKQTTSEKSIKKKSIPSAKPPRVQSENPLQNWALAVAHLMLEKKAEDVAILHVENHTSYADYFIICHAPSERQVQAIARHLDDELRHLRKPPTSTEGLEQGHWALIDVGGIVAHIFFQSARQYYDLEGFWRDVPRVEWTEKTAEKAYATLLAAKN